MRFLLYTIEIFILIQLFCSPLFGQDDEQQLFHHTAQICFCNDLSNGYLEELHQSYILSVPTIHINEEQREVFSLESIFMQILEARIQDPQAEIDNHCEDLIYDLINLNQCVNSTQNFNEELLMIYGNHLIIYEIIEDERLGLLEWNELEYYVTKLRNDINDMDLSRNENPQIIMALEDLRTCVDILIDSFDFADRIMLLDPCDDVDVKFKELLCLAFNDNKKNIPIPAKALN